MDHRTITISGSEHIPSSGAVLLVANHISDKDRSLLQQATARRIHFENIEERLKEGQLAAMFPEGSPSRTGSIETFGTDVERLLSAHPAVTVVPAALCCTRPDSRHVLFVGPPLPHPLPAPQLRQHIVELSSAGIELCRDKDSTLVHRLVQRAREYWDQPAITDAASGSLTYGELLTRALWLSGWLREQTAANSLVGVYLVAGVEAAIANYAVTLAGMAAVNLNFASGETVCRMAAEHCGLKLILTSRSFLEKVSLPVWPEMRFLEDIYPAFDAPAKERSRHDAQALPLTALASMVQPDSLACIIFSSGSTGAPKGAELTHWNVLVNADGLSAKIPPQRGDCVLGALPFFHSFGYTFALWYPVLEGLRAVFHASPLDARSIGELAQAHAATMFFSTPTFCQQYARKLNPRQFASLRYIPVGAEKLRDSVAEEFYAHFGIRLLAGYGCSELGPGVAVNVPDVLDGNVVHVGTRAGSVGRPLPGIDIRIVDPETYAPLPNGQQGLVLVKGPSRMQRYFQRPELTSQVLRDGYYVTGDLGHVDDDGFLFITDRLARFSKVAGEMVPHLRIEEAVVELTASFVTGIPDPRRGELLVLLFTNPDLRPQDVYRKLTDSGLPALWIPKRENIYFTAAIPILPSGKVNLKAARELASSFMGEGQS